MTEEAALKALDECRRRIDAFDVQIMELLNLRTREVEEIGRIKEEFRMPIYEPKREEDVFQNVTSHNIGPLPPDSVKRVFERIIDEMRMLQRLGMKKRKQQQVSDGRQGAGMND
jgi:chorismate mutase